MNARYVAQGNVIDYMPTSSDVAAGDIVVTDGIAGIAHVDIKTNTLGSLSLSGIYDFQKSSDEAIDAGDGLYWDATNAVATTTASTHTKIGYALVAAATGTTIVRGFFTGGVSNSGAIDMALAGVANGLATLGGTAKVPISQLPVAASVTDSSLLVTSALLLDWLADQSYTGEITGDGETTTFAVEHGLDSQNVLVNVYTDTAGTVTPADVTWSSTGNDAVSIVFDTAPASTDSITVVIRK